MTLLPQKLPAHWEDWCDWGLGLWLLLSPWILRFEPDAVATASTVIAGIFVLRTELVTLTVFRPWEEWMNVALGVGLVALPWVLNFETTIAPVNLTLVGPVILALALYEMRSLRRAMPPRPINR
jgi:hypothetical protein